MKKVILLVVLLFGLGWYLMDRYILWMHEYEMPPFE